MKKDRHIKEYVCLECGKEFKIHSSVLFRRKKRTGEPICKTCYKSINKGGRYQDDYYPIEIRHLLKNDYFEYEEIKNYIDTLKTKKKVKFICEICNEKDCMSILSMQNRKICSTRPICRKCSLKYALNSDEWRESNSRAQLIAQNRPEVKKKQRRAQLNLMKIDPLYADKRCSKSYISGKINGMRFDSSWELYYIAYCWESSEIKSIDRYDGYIEYFDLNGVCRKYYPDFLVTYHGSKKIVEIKGSKKYNNFHEKFNAARKKYGINYVVYGENDLREFGIFFRRKSFLIDFYRKYYDQIEFYENEKILKLKGNIEKWLGLNR